MWRTIISKMEGKKLREMLIGCANITFRMDDGTELVVESKKDGKLKFNLKYTEVKTLEYTSNPF